MNYATQQIINNIPSNDYILVKMALQVYSC